MSLPDISLLYNYKGAAYPIHLGTTSPDSSFTNTSACAVSSLVDLCCTSIVQDSTSTEYALKIIPTELCYSLMKAAVHTGRDRSIEVLISSWPWHTLSLQKFAPCLFDNVKVLHCESYLNERIRRGVKYTTCLAHTFVESLKKRAPTKLKCLDLSGYPAAEVIVNYMASHVLLVHNETRQKAIITAYNSITRDLPEDRRRQFQLDFTLPEESFIVTMDAFLQTADTHLELCKALKTSSKPQCFFKLRLNKLDMMCLGLPRICVLLEQTDPQYLVALCLQFNGLCNGALSVLVPEIMRFKELTALDLSCNSINLSSDNSQQEATELVANLLRNLPKLTRLDLSNNRTKNKLSQILSGMTHSLVYLKLCGCGISEFDLIYLQNSHHSKTLRELDLSGTDISQYLHQVMRTLSALRTTLQILELEECKLDPQCALTLFHSLDQFSNLQYLNLSRNETWSSNILDEGVAHAVQVMSLKALRVSYPAECYSIMNPDYVEEDILDYTQRINDRIEMQCDKLRRNLLKIVFIP